MKCFPEAWRYKCSIIEQDTPCFGAACVGRSGRSSPRVALCGFGVESAVHVLCASPALEDIRHPSLAGDRDLFTLIWGPLAELKTAALQKGFIRTEDDKPLPGSS